MLALLDSIKHLFTSNNIAPDISRRKRRLNIEEGSFQPKMRRIDSPNDLFKKPLCTPRNIRRLNDFIMPNMSSPIIDTPSTSKFPKTLFKKQNMKPIEIIDSSDEDDDIKLQRRYVKDNEVWIDAAIDHNDIWSRNASKVLSRSEKRKEFNSVIKGARDTLMNCNRYSNGNISSRKPIRSVLNESIRISERDKYQRLLVSCMANSKVCNGDRKFDIFKKYTKMDESGKQTQTISIDSDSDSDIKFVGSTSQTSSCTSSLPPINTMRKRLESEPITNQKWISDWSEQYSRSIETKKTEIEEHKKFLTQCRDRNHEISQKRLEEQLKRCLTIQDIIILDEDIEEEKLKLPKLTDQQESLINSALKSGPGHTVFINKFSISITRTDLHTLRGLNWLNDAVINFYTSLISERGNGKNPKLPKVHSMNTFFYPKLVSQGYTMLRRWTRRVDIFAHDIIVVPIHLGLHWCLALIDFRNKTIKYYDSMGNDNPTCLKALLNYLQQEHLDKKKTDYDVSDWKAVCIKDIPQQMNGSDCGMFACTFAEFVTRNAKILFTQENMPYFRRKMCLEIMTGELLIKS